LAAIDRPYDLVVLGAGAVGAGIALDAVTRGASVLLVDRGDFGCGTSSRSTKLFHGGVRYLPQFRFALVRESLQEQQVLARIADYLTEPLHFVMPIYRDRGFGDAPEWVQIPGVFPIAVRLGLWLYDRLGGRHRTGGVRKVTAEEMTRRFPRLKTEGLQHGLVYQDYSTDDARLVIALARTAALHGATVVNWTEATSVSQLDGVHRVELVDRLGGESYRVRGRTVVSATGAFPPPPAPGQKAIGLELSKGVHLLVSTDQLGLTDSALVLPETSDDRVMFLIPWRGWAIVGTTDTHYEGDLAHPVADDRDIAYLLAEVRAYVDVPQLDVMTAWAGLRALAVKNGTSTAQASRKHKVAELSPGYFQVAGGKLTGYRHIAEQVVDNVVGCLGIKAKARTAHLRLAGAGADESYRAGIADRVRDLGLPADYAARAVGRYGTCTGSVLDLIEKRPELGKTLGGGQWTAAEVVYAARYESAATIVDVLQQRTRMAWFTPDHGRTLAREVGQLLAGELGWDGARLSVELDRTERELAAEGL
jgi:glycerol-3-phosphate dehydrogenase